MTLSRPPNLPKIKSNYQKVGREMRGWEGNPSRENQGRVAPGRRCGRTLHARHSIYCQTVDMQGLCRLPGRRVWWRAADPDAVSPNPAASARIDADPMNIIYEVEKAAEDVGSPKQTP